MMEEEKADEIEKNETDETENPDSSPAEKVVEDPVQELPALPDGAEETLIPGNEAVDTFTLFDTPGGAIFVVHDITLGDLLISTILMAFLIFYVVNQLIWRFSK